MSLIDLKGIKKFIIASAKNFWPWRPGRLQSGREHFTWFWLYLHVTGTLTESIRADTSSSSYGEDDADDEQIPDIEMDSPDVSSSDLLENGLDSLSLDVKTSKSSSELSAVQTEAKENQLAAKSDPNLDLKDEDESKRFIEDLLAEFDKPASIHESEIPRRTDVKEASQIMKENEEILNRIMKKKSFEEEPRTLGDGIESSELQEPQAAVASTPIKAESKIKTVLQPGERKPITFNPFPTSSRIHRKPNQVGKKLGLYPSTWSIWLSHLCILCLTEKNQLPSCFEMCFQCDKITPE